MLNASTLFLPSEYASVAPHHGSPQTQNIQNAVAHAQSSEPLACCTTQQMPTVWKQRSVAYCLPIVRLLSRATGVDAGGQVAVAGGLWGMGTLVSEAATFFHFAFGD
jgi:hypothetical protein